MPTIEDLCAGAPLVAFERGDVLLAEGQTTGRLYALMSGTVEIVKGDYQINIVSDRGALFGDVSVLLGIPHMATVRAVTRCEAFEMGDANAFLRANPELSYVLAQLLAHRLHGVTAYLVDLKHQFEDHANHFGMVDEILESLVHDQRRPFTPGSEREPDY